MSNVSMLRPVLCRDRYFLCVYLAVGFLDGASLLDEISSYFHRKKTIKHIIKLLKYMNIPQVFEQFAFLLVFPLYFGQLLRM